MFFDLNADTGYLNLPILAKLRGRAGAWSGAVYAGPFIGVPLTFEDNSMNDASSNLAVSHAGEPLGLVLGAEAGRKLGPGHAILDIRVDGSDPICWVSGVEGWPLRVQERGGANRWRRVYLLTQQG